MALLTPQINTQLVLQAWDYVAPAQLPAPTGLTLTVISATEIDAAWNAIPNATTSQVYQLQRAVVTNGVIGNFQSANSGLNTSYNDTTRRAGATYAYRVLAIANGAFATSDPSAVVQATTPGGSPVITPGTTVSTPVITPFTTTAY